MTSSTNKSIKSMTDDVESILAIMQVLQRLARSHTTVANQVVQLLVRSWRRVCKKHPGTVPGLRRCPTSFREARQYFQRLLSNPDAFARLYATTSHWATYIWNVLQTYTRQTIRRSQGVRTKAICGGTKAHALPKILLQMKANHGDTTVWLVLKNVPFSDFGFKFVRLMLTNDHMKMIRESLVNDNIVESEQAADETENTDLMVPIESIFERHQVDASAASCSSMDDFKHGVHSIAAQTLFGDLTIRKPIPCTFSVAVLNKGPLAPLTPNESLVMYHREKCTPSILLKVLEQLHLK